jgi:hypothetical protein
VGLADGALPAECDLRDRLAVQPLFQRQPDMVLSKAAVSQNMVGRRTRTPASSSTVMPGALVSNPGVRMSGRSITSTSPVVSAFCHTVGSVMAGTAAVSTWPTSGFRRFSALAEATRTPGSVSTTLQGPARQRPGSLSCRPSGYCSIL